MSLDFGEFSPDFSHRNEREMYENERDLIHARFWCVYGVGNGWFCDSCSILGDFRGSNMCNIPRGILHMLEPLKSPKIEHESQNHPFPTP